MSRTQAHKPWKFRSEDEKPQGGSGPWHGYVRSLHVYGWPRAGKPARRQLEKAHRQDTKRRLQDPDNYVDQRPERMIYHII